MRDHALCHYGRAALPVRHRRPLCPQWRQAPGGCGVPCEDEGWRGDHQRLPGCQRERGRPAGRSELRQGQGRRSGRVAEREGSQLGPGLPPGCLLHAPHRRRHQRSSETHRRGIGGHCRELRLISIPGQTPLP